MEVENIPTTLTEFIFEKIKNETVNRIPGLSDDNIAMYLDSINNKEQRELLSVIIKNTRHLHTDEILDKMIFSAYEIVESVTHDFMLLINEDEINTDFYFASKVREMLKKSKYFKGVSGLRSLDDECDYIIVHDACLTGEYVERYIQECSHEIQTYHIICPYYTLDAIALIFTVAESKGHKVIFHSHEILSSICDILDVTKYSDILNLHEYTGSENNPAPVFFDHRMPCNRGSFTHIYENGFITPTYYSGTLFIGGINPRCLCMDEIQKYVDEFHHKSPKLRNSRKARKYRARHAMK